MGTRARIGVKTSEGIKSIYLHWDGYPSHAGTILQEHYNDADKVQQLIEMGDMSILAPEIGVKHPFSSLDCGMTTKEYEDQFGNMCVFYGRDRGETRTEAKDSVGEYSFKLVADNCGAEYWYLFENGNWKSGKVEVK